MPVKLTGTLAIALCFFVGVHVGFSQSQGLSNNNWYFGNSQEGIIFNKSDNQPVIVTNQFIPFGNAGAAVATDPVSGDVLFYTDGSTVYDATHQVMANGTALTSNNNGNQNVAVANVPNDSAKYYIFTNTASFTTAGTIFYTVVDMALPGNAVFPNPFLGQVDNANKNIPTSLTSSGEAMIVINKANFQGFWLISKRSGNNDIYDVLDITNGIGAVALAGSYNIGQPIVAGNFSYHETSGSLAVSPQNENRNIQILNFDNATGVLTFNSEVLNSGYNNLSGEAVYDTEWSPNGNFLYFSRHGGGGFTGDLFQADLLNPGVTHPSLLAAPLANSYGLQMGPDGRIYHLYQSGATIAVGRIDTPDSTATALVYDASPFGNIDLAGRQFPATLPAYDQMPTADFTFQGTCANQPTTFYPMVSPIPESISWNFGDGSQPSTDWSPIYTYTMGGSFNVTMTAIVSGQPVVVNRPVNITNFDLQIQLVQDTVACREEFPPPRGSSTPTQFSVTATFNGSQQPQNNDIVWSNGDIGPTLFPDSAGTYYVVATIGSCAASATVNVQEYGLQDQRSNIWYFGQNAGIDFNQQPPVALDNSIMVAQEGCVAISDQNGQILFYTDGSSVYVEDPVTLVHSEIATNIGGDPDATQSVLATQFPTDQTLWYIFTNQAVHGTNTYELKYSVFDLKANNGTGGIIEQDVTLFTKGTERLTSDGNWVLMHEYGNNTFRAYPILQTGIGAPVLSTVGEVHATSIERNGHGYMKLSSDGARLAVALSNSDAENFIEVFSFDNMTGDIADYRQIDLGADGASGQVYGLEFSPGGNKLFATVKNPGGGSQLFEYRADSLDRLFFRQVIADAAELGAIQTGPDGQVYVAINNSANLGTIQPNEDTLLLSGYTPAGFALAAGTQSQLGLPNFVQSQATQTAQASFTTSAPACVNTPVQFTAVPTSIIDEFEWSFGDGNTSTMQNPTHTYTTAGTFTVGLRVFNRCQDPIALLSEDITIDPNPPTPENLAVEVLCQGSVTLTALSTPDPTLTTMWSTGETTNSITVTQQGNYTVTLTNAGGCTSTMTTFVGDGTPAFTLGADQTVCQNAFVTALNTNLVGNFAFQWFINGADQNTNQPTLAVDTSVPGVFTYVAVATDQTPGFGNCVARDTVEITVLAEPSANITPTDATVCGANDGEISIDLPTAGSFSFSIAGPTPSNGMNITGPTTITTGTVLTPGTYTVTITDEVTGCTNVSTQTIQDPPVFTINSATPVAGCDPLVIDVVLGGAPVGPVDYLLTNTNDNSTTSENGVALSPGLGFTTLGVPSGPYTLQVTDNAGCVQVFGPFTVTQNAQADISLAFDTCVDPPTITASSTLATADRFFTWNTTDGNFTIDGSFSDNSVIEVGPSPATYTATITDLNTGLCDSTVSVTVNPLTLQTVNITAGGSPCDGQRTLTADVTPAGNFSFQWFQDGVQFAIGQVVNVSTTADYSVSVLSQQSGCSVTSNPLNVVVSEPVSVSITSNATCDTGQPFTINSQVTATLPVTFRWFRNGTELTGQTADSLQETRSGTYILEIENSVGCMDSDTIDIILFPVTEGVLPISAIICPDDPDPDVSQIELDPGPFASYTWRNEAGNIISNGATLVVTSAGLITVDLTNAFGCMTQDTIRVVEDCIPQVFGPNAFKPTGSNSEFFLFTRFLIDFEVFIYSRWGELVYQSSQTDFRWDGTLNGEVLPSGSYAWVAKFRSEFNPDQGVMEKRGGVMLLR